MEPVLDAIVAHLTSRQEVLTALARFRQRADPWLKIELLGLLTRLQREGILAAAAHDRQGADLWFKRGDDEVWLTVKTLLTPFAAPPPQPALATLVTEVQQALNKIAGLAALSGGKAVLVLVAYPFTDSPRERADWAVQLERLELRGPKRVREATVPVGTELQARIYCYRA